jgi:Ca2+-binding EF-hand superfamily protein
MSRLPCGDQGCKAELMAALSAVFDRSATGQVSLAEWRRTMTGFGECVTDEEMDNLMRQLGADADGNITIEG